MQKEEVRKLDVLANELFTNMLASSYTTALLVSEENEKAIEVLFSCQLAQKRTTHKILDRTGKTG